MHLLTSWTWEARTNFALLGQTSAVVHGRLGVDPLLRTVCPVQHHQTIPVVEIGRFNPGAVSPVQRDRLIHLVRWGPGGRDPGRGCRGPRGVPNNRRDKAVGCGLPRRHDVVGCEDRSGVATAIDPPPLGSAPWPRHLDRFVRLHVHDRATLAVVHTEPARTRAWQHNPVACMYVRGCVWAACCETE